MANILLARNLGVTNFGIFALAQGITLYFWLAVDLGTNMYGIREIARNKDGAAELVNTLQTMRIAAGVVVCLIYLLVVLHLDMPPLNRHAFLGCGLYLVTFAFSLDWVMKGFEKFQYLAISNLFYSVPFLAIAFFAQGDWGLVVSSFGWSCSFLGSALLLYLLLGKTGLRFRPVFHLRQWWEHVKESIFFSLSGSLQVLSTLLPLLFLNFFYSPYEVGIFSAAYRIVSMVCIMGTFLTMACYPVFSDLYFRDMPRFILLHRKLQLAMISAGLTAALAGYYLAPNIINSLFGVKYEGSIRILEVLIWFIPLEFFRFTYGIVFLAVNLHRHNLIIFLPGVIFMGSACYLSGDKLNAWLPYIVLLWELLLIGLYLLIYYVKRPLQIQTQATNGPKAPVQLGEA